MHWIHGSPPTHSHTEFKVAAIGREKRSGSRPRSAPTSRAEVQQPLGHPIQPGAMVSTPMKQEQMLVPEVAQLIELPDLYN